MTYWDQYRERKIDLVKDYISVMKTKKRLKLMVAMCHLKDYLRIMGACVEVNRIKRKKALIHLMIAIRFKNSY